MLPSDRAAASMRSKRYSCARVRDAEPVRIWSPKDVTLAVAAHVEGNPSLVAIGQCPHRVGDGWADRVGILHVGGRPKVILDAWVLRDDLPALGSLLPGTFSGGWDVMFATRWHWAWGGRPFFLWSRRGWKVRVVGAGRAAVRGFGQQECEVRAVRAEVSRRWLVHRVGLRIGTAKMVWVARRIEPGPLLDFTYDGLDLLADAGWASALGSALAAALQVPFEVNDPVLRPPVSGGGDTFQRTGRT